MGRKTKMNSITSPELLARVNNENLRLAEDFYNYLRSVKRSENTISGYESDLNIYWVWNLLHNNNKRFVDVKKRDIVAYQGWLLNENENSPARVRRLRATLSSLSNYIEAVLDDEYPDFRNIIGKIEAPVNEPVREKTILSDEQCRKLLDTFCERGQYRNACIVALAMCSGRRKAELVRFKVNYFTEENVVFGSLYKTPEKIRTKGRGDGKMLTCYTLKKEFKPYFDLWMEQRKKDGVESEWLFPSVDNPNEQMNANTINSIMDSCSRILGVPVYAHAFRHYFTTHLVKAGIPEVVVTEILGWADVSMCSVYVDLDADEQISRYFKDGEIIADGQKGLDSL